MSNWNDSGVIRQSSSYSVSVMPNFTQRDPREVLVFEFFNKINQFKTVENKILLLLTTLMTSDLHRRDATGGTRGLVPPLFSMGGTKRYLSHI